MSFVMFVATCLKHFMHLIMSRWLLFLFAFIEFCLCEQMSCESLGQCNIRYTVATIIQIKFEIQRALKVNGVN